MLAIGTKAPEFTLPDQNGEMKSLSDFRGQKVILYFYPKDMTSGCTSQACNFRDLYPQLREKRRSRSWREQGQRGITQKV